MAHPHPAAAGFADPMPFPATPATTPAAIPADRIASVGAALSGAGIALLLQQRWWDEAAWTHATRGFFQFKRHIPGLLA